jgi:predicted transcriptional regulator of viral defense system
MNIYELRTLFDAEIIDFNQLNAILQLYAHPRGKIHQWLNTGALIRVKKGLYVFGQQARRKTYSLELLANLIYGPSAISLHYALAYYGLIPEAVYTVTSITNKRNKVFNTPVGVFTYSYLHPLKYAIGINLETGIDGRNFLIASPEKALCDTLILANEKLKFMHNDDVATFLFENLRIDETVFKELSFSSIKKIAACYNHLSLKHLVSYLGK